MIYGKRACNPIPSLIGIADGKIFLGTSLYVNEEHRFTKVIDLEGNRLDKQFGLTNRDTPVDS